MLIFQGSVKLPYNHIPLHKSHNRLKMNMNKKYEFYTLTTYPKDKIYTYEKREKCHKIIYTKIINFIYF